MQPPTRFIRYALLITVLAVWLSACTETPQVARTPIRLRVGDAADQSVVIDRLLETYAKDREWVIFSHDELSSADSLDRLRNDHLDLAIVPATQDLATVHVWTSGLAYDSLAIIVHPSNPISDLTLTQLRDIFQGGYGDWTALGGTGEVIPVSRETNSIARTLFEDRVMGGRAVTLNAILKGSTTDVINFVAQTPGAIGYVSLSHVDDRVKVVNLDGVKPSPQSAAAGQYVLASPLYLIARAEPVGDAREFAAWLLSDEGQLILSQAGLGRVK
ncbi:MAG: substrate-binding domain-containing protein [Anaerolineae bacterium]